MPPILKNVRSLVAITLVLAVGVVAFRGLDERAHATAYFPATVGVYEGSEVRLMGVPIGTVTKISPQGTHVRMDLEYDAQYKVPADAGAVIVSPSIVADRFVQLTPAYDGSGPVMADNATIPISRTQVPVELDEIYATTNDLLHTLGPDGVNKSGSLNRVLSVAADNLDGNGTQLRRTVTGLADATSTLGDSSGELFRGIGHLEQFTKMLASDDDNVREFNDQMAEVAEFLAGERTELSEALQGLAASLGLVAEFVRDNRALIATNVDQLAAVSTALVAEKEALSDFMRVLPAAASNMARAFDNDNRSIRARANESQLLNDIGGLLCDSIERQGIQEPDAVCAQLTALFSGLGLI